MTLKRSLWFINLIIFFKYGIWTLYSVKNGFVYHKQTKGTVIKQLHCMDCKASRNEQVGCLETRRCCCGGMPVVTWLWWRHQKEVIATPSKQEGKQLKGERVRRKGQGGERREGRREVTHTDHTKFTLKHSVLIKVQVPLFTGGIFSLSLSLSYSTEANSPNPRAVSNDGAS